MTPKSVLILAGITAVSVIAATVAVVDRADQFAKEATGVLVFPTLTDQANDVTKVIVTTNKEKVIVEKGKAGWIMKSKDGYPVNIGAVRRIVAGLASLRTIERMTDQPKNYSKLEVEDVTKKDARSKIVALEDGKGKSLGKVIIGKLELITSHANVPGLYIRRPGEKSSWRAEGEIIVPSSPENWLVGQIIDIKKQDIKKVTFRDEGEKGKTFSVQRAAADKPFALAPKPKKGALKKDVANGLTDLLSGVELQDVRKKGKVQFTANIRKVTVETLDGLVVKLDVLKLMDKYWANIQVEAAVGSKGDVAKRAQEINKRVQDWTYEIIDWKGDKYATKYKDLVDLKAKAGS